MRPVLLLLGIVVLFVGLYEVTAPAPLIPTATAAAVRIGFLALALVGGSLLLFAGFRPPASRPPEPPRIG